MTEKYWSPAATATVKLLNAATASSLPDFEWQAYGPSGAEDRIRLVGKRSQEAGTGTSKQELDALKRAFASNAQIYDSTNPEANGQGRAATRMYLATRQHRVTYQLEIRVHPDHDPADFDPEALRRVLPSLTARIKKELQASANPPQTAFKHAAAPPILERVIKAPSRAKDKTPGPGGR